MPNLEGKSYNMLLRPVYSRLILLAPQPSSVDATTSAGHNTPEAMPQLPNTSSAGFPAGEGWWSGFARPSTLAPGAMGQPMCPYGYQGQDLTQSIQEFPHLATPPTTGYPSMNLLTTDMQAPLYPSQPDAAPWPNEALPALEDFQAYHNSQIFASNPQHYRNM